MQPTLRQLFNSRFTKEKYQAYLKQLDDLHPGSLDFRNAETPLFVPLRFKEQLLDTCEDIISIITRPDFKELTERSIPNNLRVPNEGTHPEFVVFDFGICENAAGALEPQLIEMQGFPTLFAFQSFQTRFARAYAEVPDTYDAYLNNYNEESYLALLKEILLNGHDADHVILLEIYPEQQKTRIDFYCTEILLGITPVCVTRLIPVDNKLYYEKNGQLIRIHRIYNRLIFDDLHQQTNLPPIIDFSQPWEVEWVSHPNWFYRISKFTLPFIRHPFVPETQFLNDANVETHQLKEYVLKPLFSFAGMGVVIDVTEADIRKIKDPENWILQRKVQYADVIATPDGCAKAEIRLFYCWKEEWKKPVGVLNLARLSKGKMIGTRYNKDKEWVGSSVAFFEK